MKQWFKKKVSSSTVKRLAHTHFVSRFYPKKCLLAPVVGSYLNEPILLSAALWAPPVGLNVSGEAPYVLLLLLLLDEEEAPEVSSSSSSPTLNRAESTSILFKCSSQNIFSQKWILDLWIPRWISRSGFMIMWCWLVAVKGFQIGVTPS